MAAGAQLIAVLAIAIALVPAIAQATPRDRPTVSATSPRLRDAITPQMLDGPRLAAAIFHATNRVRAQLHLPAFKWRTSLNRAADIQATYCALSLTAGHDNPVPDLATSMDRVKYVGLTPLFVAENAALLPMLDVVAQHGVVERLDPDGMHYFDGATAEPVHWHTYQSFAAKVVDAWMQSPGHRANIVNPSLRYLGCSGRTGRLVSGVDVIAAVQVFYTPRHRH